MGNGSIFAFQTHIQTSALQGEEELRSDNGNNSSRRDAIEFCKQGRLAEALNIVQHHVNWVDSNLYASLLTASINTEALAEGKIIHSHIIQKAFVPNAFLGTKIVLMYVKCKNLVDARRVLDELPKRDVVSWTAMIAAYSKKGFHEEALALFHQMQETGVEPDQFTIASVLQACANTGDLQQGKDVHEIIIRKGLKPDVVVGSALVDMYVKCGSVEDARNVFDNMPERNVVSWTAMVSGYTQNGFVKEARELFEIMPERNVFSWNAMIAGYAQNGQVDEALEFFQKMPKRDVVSWSTMIAGFSQNAHFSEALKLFRQMQGTGMKPNPVTYVSILPACANSAALQQGKEIHEDLIRNGLQSNVNVTNAVIDMYTKCGCLEIALKVFDEMCERDVVSWNAMITGYALHGCGKEAIQLFEQMQNSSDVRPNRVTFIGLLFGCCHAGLLEDGWKYFNGMSEVYHIPPTVEHYCCMVDLLGRAGCLHEALDFIKKMAIKPNAAVWASLLGACRIHANIEIAERAAEHLFELDPSNGAHYSMLSNIYAAASRWDDVEKVRKMMKERDVKKIPGCSWVEVNNKVYAFAIGERPYLQKQKIYAELERLSGQMKEAGYVPNKDFVLHDVEDEQKEHVLYHHSEKLALAFGLINTPPSIPIRIIKNLRVCGDCHSAIKFISKIVVREFFVRDATRFHHFKDGQCSCGGYW